MTERIYTVSARQKYKAEIVMAMGGACYRCGETRLAALTLHHRNPADRRVPNNGDRGGENLRTLWGRKPTTATWAEVWLCDLLCFTCHHVHHTVSYDTTMTAAQYLHEEAHRVKRPLPLAHKYPSTAGLPKDSDEWKAARRMQQRLARAKTDATTSDSTTASEVVAQ